MKKSFDIVTPHIQDTGTPKSKRVKSVNSVNDVKSSDPFDSIDRQHLVVRDKDILRKLFSRAFHEHEGLGEITEAALRLYLGKKDYPPVPPEKLRKYFRKKSW